VFSQSNPASADNFVSSGWHVLCCDSRAMEAMKLGVADFLQKPFDPKAVQLLC
jgi:hypothetical protein